MAKIMQWLAGFFEEDKGYASAMRLIMLAVTFAVIGVWATVSLYKMEIQDLPAGILGALLGVWALKQAQKMTEVKREVQEIKAGQGGQAQ